MGIHSCKDQEILINSLNFPTPTAPPEDIFIPSAPFLDELECIICMEQQVIIIYFIKMFYLKIHFLFLI